MISELCRPRPEPRVVSQVEALPETALFFSVLTVGELVRGVAKLDEGRRKRWLASWVRALVEAAGDRVLPIDLPTARRWGELTAQAAASGRTLPPVDGLIAATALRHGMRLMTRNVSDFAATGVVIVNPWEASPARPDDG